LAYFLVTRYIFPRFGKLQQEESGNPAQLRIRDLEGLAVLSAKLLQLRSSASCCLAAPVTAGRIDFTSLGMNGSSIETLIRV
jgi:hypothetical protein